MSEPLVGALIAAKILVICGMSGKRLTLMTGRRALVGLLGVG